MTRIRVYHHALPMPLLLACLLAAACAGSTSKTAAGAAGSVTCSHVSAKPTRASTAKPRLGRVVIVVMENKGCEEVIGSPEAPYLNRLASRYAFASRFFATERPSLPNYIALTSGSTFGLDHNCTECSFRVKNIVDQLEAARISWKAYMESLPSTCFRGPEAPNQYVKEHNPFVYYVNVASNPARCRHVVAFDQLERDMAAKKLPRYAWISPNNCHNSHNCSIRDGDRFLSGLVPRLLRAVGRRGLVVITYDEGNDRLGCCRLAAGGQIATVIAGPAARRGGNSAVAYDHYSLLRTIEDGWGLRRLRGAGCPCTRSLAALLR